MCVCIVNISLKLAYYSKDVLSEDRAIGDASSADKSNFLHPVLYYCKEPIESKSMVMTIQLVCVFCLLHTIK